MRLLLRYPITKKKYYLFFFFTKYKNECKEHKFWRQKNQKSDFYKNRKVFKIDEIDVDKILVSKIELYDTNKSIKYFIEYNDDDDDDVRPLCIKFPEMIGYVECFYNNKTISFKVTDKKLLKNYTNIWEKVSNLLKIKFDSKPVYGDNDKYLNYTLSSNTFGRM